MKQLQKLLTSVLSLTVIVAALAFTSITANAEEGYGYTIKIVLAGSSNEGASFLSVDELISSGYLTVERDGSSSYNAEVVGDTLEISGLKYNDRITFNASSAITLNPKDEEGNPLDYKKYYVKGLRIAGTDTVISKTSFDVYEDITYVVAYGVGDIVEYQVNYVDESGNKLIESTTGYSAAHQELYVPYRYISGYYPNAYNIYTSSLKSPADNGDKPFEFTFVYKKGSGSSTEVLYDTETTSSSTVQGDTEYSYQTVRRSAGGTTRYNRGNGGGAAGGAAGGADDGAGAGDAAGADDTTTIADDDTPQDVINIDDEQTALAGQAKDHFMRNMIIGIIIAIIAVSTILVTLIIANKKRKQELAKVQPEKRDE